MQTLVAALFLVICIQNPQLDDSQQVENPLYTRWKNFPANTAVQYIQVTTAGNFEERRVVQYKLLEKSADKLTVEIRSRLESQKDADATSQTQVARRTFQLPPGVSKEQFSKPVGRKDEGTENLDINGRGFNTNWYIADVRVEAGITESKTWSATDVPGGLVRSVSKTPAANSITTIEITKLEIPGKPSWQNPDSPFSPDN
jgi:hypothetical protein